MNNEKNNKVIEILMVTKNQCTYLRHHHLRLWNHTASTLVTCDMNYSSENKEWGQGTVSGVSGNIMRYTERQGCVIEGEYPLLYAIN